MSLNPFRYIDELLNGITTYRLFLYGLGAVAAVAILFGATGTLPLKPEALLASLAVIVAICYVVNWALATLFNAPRNSESWLITALILWCIMPPDTQPKNLALLALTAALAMASKYLLAWRHKHIFNPAAIAAVTVNLLGLTAASWWIADKEMLPAVLLLGILVVRKMRRIQMVLLFVLISLAMIVWRGAGEGLSVASAASGAFTSWPLLFLGTIMLTEPSTMPPRPRMQWIYAALVALIFTSERHVGPVFSTPEIALICGNIFAYLVSPRYKLRLTLKSKTQLSSRIWDLAFTPSRPARFLPGQYMEWTLPHPHTDGRGNRRTFTIASAPDEKEIHLGIKTYERTSSFKSALLALPVGGTLEAGQVAGSFTLPKNTDQPLLFIAGGIGITPFRSMLKDLIDRGEHRDVVLIYSVATADEVSYASILKQAEKVGLRTLNVVGTPTLNTDILQRNVPDFADRKAYISGPNAMVRTWRDLLLRSRVRPNRIVTDYFPGY